MIINPTLVMNEMIKPAERVKFQRDRIIASAESVNKNLIDVIVQVKGNEREQEALKKMSELVAETEMRRSMVTNPKLLRPAPKADMTEEVTKYRSGKLRDQHASMAAQLRRSDIFSEVKAARKNEGSRVKMFLNQADIGSSVSRGRRTPNVFNTADSVAIRVHKDDLAKMIDDDRDDHIAGIFENSTVRMPKFSEGAMPQNASSGGTHTHSWGLHDTNAMTVWGAFDTRGDGINVAVLDTGIDATHNDLSGKIAAWAEFDGQGLPVNSTVHDSGTHGTHVAGTIVGGNKSGTAIGMAPNAKVFGSRVLGPNGGSSKQIMAGMDWAINSQSHVINMSLGGLELDTVCLLPYYQQIYSALMAGIPVVAAIGNDGDQLTGAPGNDYDAFAIGALNYDSRIASFSGGRNHVMYTTNGYVAYTKPDICAPGVDVYSCVPNGGYEFYNGTSMATPHVSGAIALLLSATSIGTLDPFVSVHVIKELFEATARPLGENGKDTRYGRGAIDIYKAIDVAKELGY